MVTASLADSLPIIPLPQSVSTNGQSFTITTNTAILHDAQLANEAGFLADKLGPATGFVPALYPLSQSNSVSSAIFLTLDAALTNAESYELTVDTNGVFISGADAPGAFYGSQSLLQIVSVTAPYTVPGCAVADAPRFQWRGMHLDVGRHMFPVDDIKKFIDWMAYHKLNSFHWHLTEDQGWRIEILSHPLLTSVGGFRDSTPPYGDRRGSDGTPYGGYYTQIEISNVVAYATARHINIVPEIDMPGHMSAAIAAYPSLGNDDVVGYAPTVQTLWGVHPYTLAPKESTFDWIDDVLTEICALFPSTYIHIGSDEAPKGQWEQSAFAQLVMAANGLANEDELQSWFIQRVETILASKGRKLIGWDEIRQGGLSTAATVMNWRGSSEAVLSAQEGHDVVMANTSHTYFDFYQNNASLELAKGIGFEAIGGYLPIENVYGYEPIPTDLQGTTNAVHILGCQAQLWTEYMHTWDKVEYMAFPRIAAIAEVAWTDPANKDFADFETRLQPMLARYAAAGLNYFYPNNVGPVAPIDDATFQTSLDDYAGHVPELAYDGDENTFFWSNRGPNTSDYFTVDLNNSHTGMVTVLTGRISDGVGLLESGVVEASTNGVDWGSVAVFSSGTATGLVPDGTTYLRILPTANQESWLIIREIVFSDPGDPPGVLEWMEQATNTPGNVTASHNGGLGWIFNGSSGVDYDFGALDEIEGKPVDGSTVEFLFSFIDASRSTAMASVEGYSPGSEMNVLKLEQYSNTGKFGITVPGLWDYTLATDSAFDQTVHVVFVRNADGTMDLYINGVFAETDTHKTDWRMDGGLGKLGANTAGVDVPTGILYGVASYDTPLNPTQIANLYNASASGTSPDPVVVFIDGAVSGGTGIALSWTGQVSRTYGVETNSSLGDGGWGSLVSGIPGTGGLVGITNTIGPNQTFYRVITE